MTDETYQLTVTLTASEVSAAASGPEWDHEVPALELDLSARNTIEVLRAWLLRWGALTTIRNKTPKTYDSLPVPETFKALGEQLYRLAFPGDVGRLLERTRAKADTAGRSSGVATRASSACCDGNHSALPTPSSMDTARASGNVATKAYSEPAAIDTMHPAASVRRAPMRSDNEPHSGVSATIVKLIAPTAKPAWPSGMPRTSWK